MDIAVHGSLCAGICSHPSHISPIPMTGRSIASVKNKLKAGGSDVCVVSDLVIAECGHTGNITSGASKVFRNGIPVAMVTSAFAGDFTGYIIQGEPKVTVV